MTYDISDSLSVVKSGNLLQNVFNMFKVDNNKIFYHISDNPDEKKVVLLLDDEFFQKYFGNSITDKNILTNVIKFSNEIEQISFQQNIQKFKNDFHSTRLIGKGGFGRVYSAVHKMDLQTYAIKRVVIDFAKVKEHAFKEALKEFQILAKLNHGNIVRYYTAWFETIEDGVDKVEERSNDSRYTCSEDSDLISSSCSKMTSAQTTNSSFSFLSGQNKSGRCDRSDDDIVFGYSSNEDASANFSPTSGQNKSGRCDRSDDDIVFGYSSNESTSANFSPTSKSFEPMENEKGQSLEIFRRTNDVNRKPKFALYIQMELCQTNLKDWLDIRNNEPGQLTESDLKNTRSLGRQLLKAVEYLHINNIIHRDMKPANVFLSSHRHCRNDCELQLKIGDFGLAKPFEYNCESNDSRMKMTANVGTQSYTAPEVNHAKHSRTRYNHKCDLYSVGIILVELMTKFQTISELVRVITNLSQGIMFNGLQETWPIEAQHVMNLISPSPHSRPDTDFILYHTLCFKEIAVECGICDQMKQLTVENLHLKKEIESLRKEIENLRSSLSETR